MRRLVLIGLLVVPNGCGGAESEPSSPDPVSPEACAAHELVLPDGSCFRPGVPPDGCAEGFVHDGVHGCEPILPTEPCPPGLMAVAGDEACRPIMDCGQGEWGDLPVDEATQYVDGATTAGDADGSEAKPWPTIGQAVAATSPGGLVAVAAGTYIESLLIDGKPVRLWGRCPEQVAIVATGQAVGPCPPTVLCILGGADGTEVGGVALSGSGKGILSSGSQGVVVDRVHVHDNAGQGVSIEGTVGPTSLHVRGSLIEQNRDIGLLSLEAEVTLEASVVRTTQPRLPDQLFGRGLSIQPMCVPTPTGVECDPTTRSTATVTRSLIEANHEVGLFIGGSDAAVDGTVVRATLPCAAHQGGGAGVRVEATCVDGPSGLQCDPTAGSTATLSGSLIAGSHEVGLLVMGSTVTVDRSVVRATLPTALDQRRGRGIGIQASCMVTPTGLRCDPTMRSSATVTRSLVEDNHEFGMLVLDSEAHVDGTVLRATSPRASDGLYGDGITVFSQSTALALSATGLLIDDSARAGMAIFGTTASLANTHIRCAAFELSGEPFGPFDFGLDDGGGNLCGCPVADQPCKLVTAGLEPPESLPTGN